VAIGLPVPRVSPDDPAADFLAAAAADDAQRLLDKLKMAGLQTVEAALARCRASLAAFDLDAATTSLDQARGMIEGDFDWRLRWHDGLLALAGEDMQTAEESFDAVYAALPGEDAPKLALAFCAEHSRRLGQAESYYDAVWRRDRSVVSAAFGLARVRLARGERAGAVELLDKTPAVSRHFDAARIAAVRVLSGILGEDHRPSAANLQAASDRLSELYLDGGAKTGPSRTRLAAVVQEAALGVLLAAKDRKQLDGGEVIVSDPDEAELRLRLERSYRALARQADIRAHHSDLVDLANRHRPITFR
jgi:serine/threonine-protein kinase PknG